MLIADLGRRPGTFFAPGVVMRTITGALLIVAAAVCFLGGILAQNQEANVQPFGLVNVAYTFAGGLALSGLILMSRGLAGDDPRPRESHQNR